MRILAAAAFLPEGWRRNVSIEIVGTKIAAVAVNTSARPGDIRVEALIPGLANLHSHAFQRGFAGLGETRGPHPDSFWTWREVMYRFAGSLTPEEIEAISALAYAEMLEAGFTRVGEFHYLHHAPDGTPYEDRAETSRRIFAAAQETGIALTHLPVFYAHGGFGPAPAQEGQRRFLHDLEGFQRLMEACARHLPRPEDRLGLAPHSLRAATMEEILRLAESWPGRPFHIHVAEQRREVEECLARHGARPVELLLDKAPVGPGWCLIHATHIDRAEASGLAARGAVAGLCPVTEASLGDGIFPAAAYRAAGGRIGVGTDSNIRISAAGELRALEYAQRLQHQARNICTENGSTGEALFRAALFGGAQALGMQTPGDAEPGLRAGAPADLVALRDDLGLDHAESLLDRWIFGSSVRVSEVWALGTHRVTAGRHVLSEAIRRRAGRLLRQRL